MFELGFRAALHADGDQPAVGGEDVDIAGQVLRAHVVEDDVGTVAVGLVAQPLDEVLLAVVDRDVGAELAAALELGGAARGHGDTAAGA